jgi:hypothetical protein
VVIDEGFVFSNKNHPPQDLNFDKIIVNFVINALMNNRLAFLGACVCLANTMTLAGEPLDGKGPYRLQVDNDLFAKGGASDRDYTGGISFSYAEVTDQPQTWSLRLARGALDELVLPRKATQAKTASTGQIGAVFFTPQNIEATVIDTNDRPYASLVFVANGQMSVEAERAVFSSLSVGMLGTSFAGQLHKTTHDITGSSAPSGYRHQISAGAEPTAKYSLAFQQVLAANRTGDLKATYQAHAGYLTEASGAVSFRWGKIQTPWWTFNPELSDPMANASPIASPNALKKERYVFGGAKLKARLYNAMLQGQFRDSPWRLPAQGIEPVILHAWLGGASNLFNATVSYSINYQSPEVRWGLAHRDHVWGSIQATFDF